MTKFLNISTDNTLGGVSPSDAIVSSQNAIKTYVDNCVDGVTSAIQPQLNNKISYNAIIQNLNSFNNNGKLFLSTLDNCFYSLNRRFTITGTGFTSFNAAALFDGVFENYSYNNIDVGGTGVVTVTGTAITGTYRQGYILISFYSGRGPKAASDVTIQIENANGNVATLTPTTYSTNGLVLIAEVPTLPTANAITKITITIVNNRASGTVNPVELEYFCARTSNTGLLSYVSKTGNSTIYGNLTADSFVKSGGTSTQFLKANGSVDSTSYAPMSSIPTVGNGTITITQGGVSKGTFTTNQSGDTTIALDAGGGGGAVDSVNGKTGVVVLTATDVGALPDSTVIPDAQIQSDWNQADNTKVDFIKNKPTIPAVNNSTITITQGGVTKGSFTLNQATGDTISLDAGGGGGYHPDLFDHKWADHQLNDVQWLRADTFSWQAGSVYESAYQHLADDIDGKTLQSETVAGTTIQFYLADDGHKICPASEESNVSAIYNATGVAWYYIIDTTNQRFKLPRSSHNKYTTSLSVVGNGKSLGFTNGSNIYGTRVVAGQSNACALGFSTQTVNATVGSSSSNFDTTNDSKVFGITTDESKSGLTTTTIAQDTDQYKYLYFYVGNFTQTALENTAGLNAELFNGKADTNLLNTSPTSAFATVLNSAGIRTVIATYSNDYTWYRKYSDGWVEQGGRVGANPQTSVTLPIPMASDVYHRNLTIEGVADNVNVSSKVIIASTNSTTLTIRGTYNNGLAANTNIYWEVKGMAAS